MKKNIKIYKFKWKYLNLNKGKQIWTRAEKYCNSNINLLMTIKTFEVGEIFVEKYKKLLKSIIIFDIEQKYLNSSIEKR